MLIVDPSPTACFTAFLYHFTQEDNMEYCLFFVVLFPCCICLARRVAYAPCMLSSLSLFLGCFPQVEGKNGVSVASASATDHSPWGRSTQTLFQAAPLGTKNDQYNMMFGY